MSYQQLKYISIVFVLRALWLFAACELKASASPQASILISRASNNHKNLKQKLLLLLSIIL